MTEEVKDHLRQLDESFARLADEFFRETGVQAPGQVDPLRLGPPIEDGARLARWALWLGRKRASQIEARDAEIARLRASQADLVHALRALLYIPDVILNGPQSLIAVCRKEAEELADAALARANGAAP